MRLLTSGRVVTVSQEAKRTAASRPPISAHRANPLGVSRRASRGPLVRAIQKPMRQKKTLPALALVGGPRRFTRR